MTDTRHRVEDVRIISGTVDALRGVIVVRAVGKAHGHDMEYLGLRKLRDEAVVTNHQLLDADEVERYGAETVCGDWRLSSSR